MEGGEREDSQLKVMGLMAAELATGLSWTSQHSPTQWAQASAKPFAAHLVTEKDLNHQSLLLALPQPQKMTIK